jgi:hypothetical protein
MDWGKRMTLSSDFEKVITGSSRGKCRECGEIAPAAMTKSGLCRECHCRKARKSVTEIHHPLGRQHKATIELPANVHAILTRKAECRNPLLKPTQTANQDRSPPDPLETLARYAAAASEHCETIGERSDGWIAKVAAFFARVCQWASDCALALSAWLAKKFGDDWHKGFSFPEFE